MKKVTLKFLWKNIKLNLIENKYINNNKIFYGLVENNWEYFSDITKNVDDSNRNYINNDFTYCFDSSKELREWLQKYINIKEFWKYGYWYYFIS